MMVRFRTIDLKSHLIAQFEENHIICKKILNFNFNQTFSESLHTYIYILHTFYFIVF